MPIVPSTTEELQRVSAAVRGLLRGLVNEDAADDALQETWVRALQTPPKRERNVRGWIHVVARNLALKQRRSERRRARREHLVARREASATDVDARTRLVLCRRVIDAVNTLDEPLRDVVVARYFEGLSARRIAEGRGTSRATVDRRLAHARRELRERLAKRDGDGAWSWSPALLVLAADAGISRTATAASIGSVIVMSKSIVIAVVSAAVGFTAGWVAQSEHGSDEPVTVAASHTETDVLEASPGLTGQAATERAEPPRPNPPGGDDASFDAEAWLERINRGKTAAERVKVMRELWGVDPKEGIEIVRSVWSRIAPPIARREMLAQFCHAGRLHVHKHVAGFLVLGAQDEDAQVQGEAFGILTVYAGPEIAEDHEHFEAWRDQFADATLEELLRAGVAAFLEKMKTRTGEDRVKLLRNQRALNIERGRRQGIDVIEMLRDGGAFEIAHEWWIDPEESADMRVAALQFVTLLKPDIEYLVAHVVPAINAEERLPGELFHTAAHTLGTVKHDATLDALLSAIENTPYKRRWWPLATAVAAIGNARAVPFLIGVVEADNTYDSVYGIGYFGLGRITGVSYDEKHDGAWWRSWWEKNAQRYPPDVAKLGIPSVHLRAK